MEKTEIKISMENPEIDSNLLLADDDMSVVPLGNIMEYLSDRIEILEERLDEYDEEDGEEYSIEVYKGALDELQSMRSLFRTAYPGRGDYDH